MCAGRLITEWHCSQGGRCSPALRGLILCWLILSRALSAAEAPAVAAHREDFESPNVSGRVSAEQTDGARLRSHTRTSQIAHDGRSAELLQIDAVQRGGRLYLEYATPPALVFDELQARLWLRANRPGMQIGVRIVFPRQVNPQTGHALTADLWGDVYSSTHRWQLLACRTGDDAVRQLLTRLRHQYTAALPTADLDMHGMYVDRVVLAQAVEAGASEYAVDSLELAPLIDPASNGAEIVQAGAEQEVVAPVTMGDGRLLRHGRPLFPVFTPYHDEPLELLRQSGFNLVWIPRCDDQALLAALAEQGLGAMAEPPALDVRPPDATGDVSYSVGLPRFTSASDNVVMWHLGSEVPAQGLASVRAAANAVRDADPLRRPIMVDVSGAVREFHRAVDVVGFSKHSIQTTTTPQDYLAYLQQEMLQALRGKPTCTWIFTEPNRAQLQNRPPSAIPPQLEPEQIWMQVYAALGAGVKALGYWRLSAFDDPSPAGVERRHAVTLANLQMHLLRDWLATGKVVELAPVRLGTTRPLLKPGFGSTLVSPFGRLAGNTGPVDALDANIRAPVLRCDAGLLILPQWLEPDGQYQPGPMAAVDVHILLRGIGEVTHAWEVTTTGIQPHELKVDEASGGTEITIARLDQLAAIIIPMDPSVVDELRREVAGIRETAAAAWVELAQAKLERVQSVHDVLQELAPKRVADGDYILAEARRELKTARAQLDRQGYEAARVHAELVLKLTRQVQRAHWEQAARTFASPAATPYSVCFSTLPDFWRLMQALGRGHPLAESQLRGGSFENWDSIFAAGWRYDAAEAPTVTLIELAGDGASGRCLRLAARPDPPQDSPQPVSRSPITFLTHPIPVFSGQIVHVKGLVRIDVPVSGSADGLRIYDNLYGAVGGLRWPARAPVGTWQPFELIRPIQTSTDLQLTLELTGYGDVRIDELQVTLIDVPSAVPGATALRPGTR